MRPRRWRWRCGAGGVELEGLVHHSDAGSQYASVIYSERLAELGIAPSVGSVGDSYDNAAMESAIGLYKTELIRRRGPWRSLDQVEFDTLEYIDWFNNRRLHGQIGYVPPTKFEEVIYARRSRSKSKAECLYGTQGGSETELNCVKDHLEDR